MIRSSNSPKIFRWRGALIAALALFALISADVAEAQSYCQEWSSTLLPLNTNCVSDPRRERAFGGETFSWNGEGYLVFSRGNELSLYRLGNDPAEPLYIGTSRFNFGTAGDSDYDVMAFDTCDDCRYMVMDHKVAGIVVIDLGTGAQPAFTSHTRNGNLSVGSIVFSHGGQEYLVAGRLSNQCPFGSSVFAINSATDLEFLQCVEADGADILLGGGQALNTGGETHLYLGKDRGGDVYVYKVEGNGSSATLTLTSQPPEMKGRSDELALDANHRIGVSTDFNGGRVLFWDLSIPGNPLQKTGWTIENINASMVDLASQTGVTPLTLWVGAIGWVNSTHTYLIEETGPEPMDNDFWTDTNEPHNEFQLCAMDTGAALAPDGSALYLSRYATQQTFDLSECLGPTPATAIVQVTPSAVFPGDTVTISDKTAGSYDRWALWVNKNGSYDAGDLDPSETNPHSFPYTVPKDMAEGDTFAARILIRERRHDPGGLRRRRAHQRQQCADRVLFDQPRCGCGRRHGDAHGDCRGQPVGYRSLRVGHHQSLLGEYFSDRADGAGQPRPVRRMEFQAHRQLRPRGQRRRRPG